MIDSTTFSVFLIGAMLCGGFIGWILRRSHEEPGVDPWRLQRRLMRISGQSTPDHIQLNKAVLTYLALIMEELSETIEPVNDTLARTLSLPNTSETLHHAPALRTAHQMLRNVGVDLGSISKQLRATTARLPADFHVAMKHNEALSFADGCTDLSVVNCGLTIAGGVPGPECYEEVGHSNLSKANPVTGLIDKDATGKWIKGTNYRAPNLAGVLHTMGVIL